MIVKRKIVVVGAFVVLIVIAAWFNGGEQPLRTIVEPVAVPAAAR